MWVFFSFIALENLRIVEFFNRIDFNRAICYKFCGELLLRDWFTISELIRTFSILKWKCLYRQGKQNSSVKQVKFEMLLEHRGHTPLNHSPIGFYAKALIFKACFEPKAAIFFIWKFYQSIAIWWNFNILYNSMYGSFHLLFVLDSRTVSSWSRHGAPIGGLWVFPLVKTIVVHHQVRKMYVCLPVCGLSVKTIRH